MPLYSGQQLSESIGYGFGLCRSREADVYPSRLGLETTASHTKPRATSWQGTGRLCPAFNGGSLAEPFLCYIGFLDSDCSGLVQGFGQQGKSGKVVDLSGRCMVGNERLPQSRITFETGRRRN